MLIIQCIKFFLILLVSSIKVVFIIYIKIAVTFPPIMILYNFFPPFCIYIHNHL